MQDPTDTTLQVVAFTIDQIEYAFRIDSVVEIIRFVRPQPTSSTVPWMRGVINLRGTIIPIIELGVRLGRTGIEHDPATVRILVLEDGDTMIGAVVTSVDEILAIETASIQPAPVGAGSSLIDSIATVDDRLIMVLDAAKLLDLEAQAA